MTEHKTLAQQIGNKCRHFNGIMNETCKAGVRYKEVRDSASHPYRWPCFQDNGCSERCSSVSYYTPDEVAARVAESKAALDAFLSKLNNNICPECDQPLTYKRQVGRCVYGSCGHRLYQGRLTDEERAKQPKPSMPTLRTFWEMPERERQQLTETLALASDDPWDFDEADDEEVTDALPITTPLTHPYLREQLQEERKDSAS